MQKYELTQMQREAVDKIVAFLNDPTQEIFTLSGIGGAGKTFSLKEALMSSTNVYAATVSHSAKIVLEESFREADLDVNCFTLAKLLGLKMTITDEGEIEFVPDPKREDKLPVELANLLIIDECSMISDEHHGMILALKKPSCKIIYSGDAFQLPPVDESSKDSITFNFTQYSLTEPIRYTGPIFDLGKRIRKEIQSLNENKEGTQHVINAWMREQDLTKRVSKVNEEGSGYIFLNSMEDVTRIALNFFKQKNADTAIKLMAFRNATIKKLNLGIRALLYGPDAKVYMPGELVICDGGYGPKGEIYNNQSFRVVDSMEKLGPKNIPCITLALDPPIRIKNGEEDIRVVHWDKGMAAYYEQLNKLKAYAKKDRSQWVQFYRFKEQFGVFDYNYAQNCYRGQGRTYENVIVFEGDILNLKKVKTKAQLQALYVACTRAKNIVFIYNKDYRVDNSQLDENIKLKYGLS